jgi:hypothetical protein
MGLTHPRLGVFVLAICASGFAAPVDGQGVSELRVRTAIEDASRGLGQTIAGGSPLTGPAPTTGGLGGFRVGAALGVTNVGILDPRRPTGDVDFHVPMGVLNGAVGLWGPGLGSVDIMGRAGVLTGTGDLEGSAGLLALGGRVAILDESIAMPALTASVFRSWVTGLDFEEIDSDLVSYNADVSSWSFRLDVSKAFVLVTPYAGVGIDRTDIDAAYRIPLDSSTGGVEINGDLETSSTHGKVYLGMELGLTPLGLAIEGGTYDGGWFAAVGTRIGT